jgi:hypothetical protein
MRQTFETVSSCSTCDRHCSMMGIILLRYVIPYFALWRPIGIRGGLRNEYESFKGSGEADFSAVRCKTGLRNPSNVDCPMCGVAVLHHTSLCLGCE